MGVPLTPVVGYVRTASILDRDAFRPTFDRFADATGLVVVTIVWDPVTESGPRRGGFASVLRVLRAREARGVVVADWSHLATAAEVGGVLLRTVTDLRAPWFVVDQSETPVWAWGALAAQPHPQTWGGGVR